MQSRRTNPESEPVRSDDLEDLFCLECGYNLRGLESDPRRCPECDALSTLTDMRVPAALVDAQGGQLAALPWCCGVCMLGVLIIGLPLLALYRAAGVAVILLGAAFWTIAASAFARACRRKAGCVFVLVEIHVVALLAVGFIVALNAAVPSTPAPGPGRFVTLVALALGMLALAVFLQRDARRRLVRIRRRAAVELAKHEWERRMIGPWTRRRR